MNKKIIIDFVVENETLKNSVVFENNPTVHDAIQALDSTLQMFKKAVLAKYDGDGVSDENFNSFTKEVTVNELKDG
jgi:ribosome-interacting GTPase 1